MPLLLGIAVNILTDLTKLRTRRKASSNRTLVRRGALAARKKCVRALQEIGRASAERFHALMKTYPLVNHVLLLCGTSAAILIRPRDKDHQIRKAGLDRAKLALLKDKDEYAIAVNSLRSEFRKQLATFENCLPQPIGEYVSDLLRIALANGYGIDWVSREVKIAREGFSREFANWIIIAADGSAPTGRWRAPYWLERTDNLPSELQGRAAALAVAMPGRLSEKRTAARLNEILSGIEKRLAEEEQRAFDEATIRFSGERHGKSLGSVARHGAKSKLIHSNDYASIRYRGKLRTLTPRQARVIQLLDEAREKGTPVLGKKCILAELGTPNGELRDTFRHTSLWGGGRLICPGTKRGTVRLNLP